MLCKATKKSTDLFLFYLEALHKNSRITMLGVGLGEGFLDDICELNPYLSWL